MQTGTGLAIHAAAAVVVVVSSAWGAFAVRGSTAVPAAGWAAAAGLALLAETAATAAGWLGDAASRAAARLAVISLASCPAMAVLGAKRPQHHVWQLIVASLAVVLAMPAVSAAVVRPGSLPDVHLLQRAFMPLVALVGWMNFAATRHGVAAALVTVGQLMMMRPFLPLTDTGAALAATAVDAGGAVVLACGALLAALLSARPPVTGRGASHGAAAVIDPPFLALRETLGAAWTLRIADRFNAAAESHGWPCRLRFSGLEAGERVGDEPWRDDAIRCWRALMRRFVTDGWLHRHRGKTRIS